MKQFLLDTNICIFFIKGRYKLDEKIAAAGVQHCFISEMTVAESKYGVENSPNQAALRPVIEAFLPKFGVVPVFEALDVFAREKARLRRLGLLIDDFDILIGATAITHQLTMVTNNVGHLQRLNGIVIDDWTAVLPA